MTIEEATEMLLEAGVPAERIDHKMWTVAASFPNGIQRWAEVILAEYEESK